MLEDPRDLSRLPRFTSPCRRCLVQLVGDLLERPSLRSQNEDLPDDIRLVFVDNKFVILRDIAVLGRSAGEAASLRLFSAPAGHPTDIQSAKIGPGQIRGLATQINPDRKPPVKPIKGPTSGNDGK